MKRLFLLLLVLAVLPFAALAADASAPVGGAMADLTEVFGYTQEEAEAFTFDVTETDTTWEVAYYDPDHPTWVYTSVTDKETGRYISAATPFKGPDYARYPGESAVRDGLRAARENGRFTDLSAESRAAFLAWMEQWGVHANDALRDGLETGTITGAQAVHAYFMSCYGDPSGWPDALLEWEAEELNSYDFPAEDAQAAVAEALPTPVAGIHRYEGAAKGGGRAVAVTEFSGETPEDLQQALAHPMLAGWTCVCGAYYAVETPGVYLPAGMGLLALEKDGGRMLVSLYRAPEAEDWTVLPVGEAALLSGRTLCITYDAGDSEFTLSYPVSDTECESFIVYAQYGEGYGPLFRLEEYRHVNTATGESTSITVAGGLPSAENTDMWYHVVSTDAAGSTTEEQHTVLMPRYLEFIDADAFPKTAEACRTAVGYTVPDGCAVACGAHLRKQTSSHSADLGTYETGVLMEVLGTEAGDPYPWYHVRIGSAEGYMSGLYVDTPGSDCSMQPLRQNQPLRVAKATKSVKLKTSAHWLSGTVATLPAGTKMHILAETGSWLHVMIPQGGEPGWLMDTQGTDGYLKKSAVVTAATSLQLDWLE